MNSPINFPPPQPTLKLTRPAPDKWAATLAEERRRLQEDQDTLREREANLREYEERLRTWQAEIDASRQQAAPAPRVAGGTAPFLRPSSKAPFADDAALQAAWEKLHRARELFEAEQSHLREDRLALREQAENLKHREDMLAAREAALQEREALVAEALGMKAPAPQPIASEHTMSAVTRLTRAPFDMARSVFGGRK
jgi:hypothetical protein